MVSWLLAIALATTLLGGAAPVFPFTTFEHIIAYGPPGWPIHKAQIVPCPQAAILMGEFHNEANTEGWIVYLPFYEEQRTKPHPFVGSHYVRESKYPGPDWLAFGWANPDGSIVVDRVEQFDLPRHGEGPCRHLFPGVEA